jgi:hypothetical protein
VAAESPEGVTHAVGEPTLHLADFQMDDDLGGMIAMDRGRDVGRVFRTASSTPMIGSARFSSREAAKAEPASRATAKAVAVRKTITTFLPTCYVPRTQFGVRPIGRSPTLAHDLGQKTMIALFGARQPDWL